MSAVGLWAPVEVADAEPARAYYAEVLGLPLLHEWRTGGEHGLIFGVGASGRIEVVSPVTGSPPPSRAIEVASWAEVDRLHLRHGGAGAAPVVHPRGHYGFRAVDPTGTGLLIWGEHR